MVTWEVKVTPLNVQRKEASVTATRSDSVTGSVKSYNIITCILDTDAQKLSVLDQLKQMHLDYEAHQAAIDAYVGELESQAKASLEAWDNG